MTSLVLTHDDQRRLAAATEALLSPLAYTDADAWRSAVCARLRELLRADMAMVLLPGDERVELYAEGYDPAVAEYPSWIEPVADQFKMFERLCTLGAATRPMLWGDMDAYRRTPYYNEYCVPNRATTASH